MIFDLEEVCYLGENNVSFSLSRVVQGPTLLCSDASYRLPPGTCVDLINPCADGQWVAGDALTLYSLPPGVAVHTTRSGSSPPARQLCAEADTPLVAKQEVPYIHSRGDEFGGGALDPHRLFISVATDLVVTASAAPTTINPFESTQLEAVVSGGVMPYAFFWQPTTRVSDPRSSQTSAAPLSTTQYTVTVFDAADQRAAASVVVHVTTLALIATADPEVINVGDSSQLIAAVSGGTWPYTFSWSPATGLSATDIQDPIATPSVTTTYTVVITDSGGLQASDAIQVTVVVPLTVSFVQNLTCCPSLSLDASASTGNIVSYTWDLSWTAANPDRVTTSPTTSFTVREGNRGTIRLTVTDSAGNTATTTQAFFF